MKKNRRYLQLLFSFVVLLLCLTACGGKEANIEQAADMTGTASAPVSADIITPIKTEAPTILPAQTEAPTASPSTEKGAATSAMPTPPIAPPDVYKLAAYEELAEGYRIPIINIYTKDRAEILSLEEYVACVVDVFNCDEAYAMDEVPAGIKVRGNSSAYYGDVEQIREYKAPYRIKFETKQNMLGLNNGAECKSWVLLKSDWNLIPNDLAFRMGRAILNGHGFCSDSTFVHLYVNEAFYGVYLLCEQSQVNINRVNIREPKAGNEGTNVGYYLEIDNYAAVEPDNYYFVQNYANGTVTDIEGVTRSFVPAEYSIKSEVTSDTQVEFIDRYMNNLFTVLYEACVNDNYMTLNPGGVPMSSDYTSSYEVADALLDLKSVVNMYILYEIVHDNDCGEGSFYMCIDFSPNSTCPKLQFTSPWDFNWAYGEEPAGQYYAAAFCSEEFVKDFSDRSNPWFILLMTEDWFLEMVQEKWTSLRTDGTLEACLLAQEDYLSTYEKDLNAVQEWSTGAAYDLLSWVRTRIEWLDSQWLPTD